MAFVADLKPHSCRHCRKLVLDFSQKRYMPLRHETGHPPYIFNFTMVNVERAAAKGCSFCSQLLKKGNQSGYTWSKHAKLAAACRRMGWMDFLEFYIEPPNSFDHSKMLGSFLMSARADNIASQDIYTRPINRQPRSDETFQLAKSWLESCRTHKNCQQPKNKFMPTRLIEISSDRRGSKIIRLRQRNPDPKVADEYAALSYCWGGDQRVKTTKNTLQNYMTRIDWEDLPCSLQDGIQVTEKLGLKLIWIDSLCIVQDDDLDKAAEISQMTSIYVHATVTILASRAASVEEGFLQARDLSIVGQSPDLVFQLPFVPHRSAQRKAGSVILTTGIKEADPVEPLESRGWAMQERLLSSRILEYTSLQTRWICREESPLPFPIVDGWIRSTSKSSIFYTMKIPMLRTMEEPESSGNSETVQIDPGDDFLGNLEFPQEVRHPQFEKDGVLREWYNILRHYSARKFSVPDDRLPAISGIAERYARLLKDDYFLGLWRSRLPQELLWSKSDHGRLPPRNYTNSPTWSWASVNGKVDFDDREPDSHSSDCIQIKEFRMESSVDDSTVADNSAYSAMSGRLVLTGGIRAAHWICLKYNQYYRLCKCDVNGNPNPGSLLPGQIIPDALEKEFMDDNCFCILVFLLKISSDAVYSKGLVLRQTGLREYSRLGIFEFSKWAIKVPDKLPYQEKDALRNAVWQDQVRWLDGFKAQTITLV